MRRALSIFARLTRVKLALFSGMASFAGHCLYTGNISSEALIPALGVYLFASGASALNQYQERATDALMKRTMSRPIPSGRLRPVSALAIGATLILCAIVLMWGTASVVALAAVVIYNAIYTPLKRKTGFAILVGAIAGAMPPVVGWAYAGGDIFSLPIMLVFMIFYIWQAPHFMLLLINHVNDYRASGLPTIASLLTMDQLRRVCVTWACASIAAALALPSFYSHPAFDVSTLFTAGASLVMLMVMVFLAIGKTGRATFALSNVYMLLVMLALIA